MVVIVDIVDMGRVLVDGLKNFPRVIYPLRRLTLTKMRLPLLRGARTTTLAKAAKAFGLDEKWAANPSNVKMTKFTTRRNLTDLQRFQVMVARKQRSYALKHPNGAKKAAPKAAPAKAKAAAPAKKAAAPKKK
jgi:large subunit ribosomal protein L14e